MATAKEEVRDLLENLLDEATFDDIEYQIYVLHEIREGVAEADRGELIDHEEVKVRMGQVARRIRWTPRAVLLP
jgi:predicted transcriptional regulator